MKKARFRLFATVTLASVLALSGLAGADTADADGDTAVPSGNVSATCAAKTANGSVTLKYTGTNHYSAGEQLNISVSIQAPDAVTHGVTSGPTNATNTVDAGYDTNNDLSVFPITTSIPANTPPGPYKVTYTIAGQSSERSLDTSFNVNVTCESSTNTAPTIAWTANPSSVNEHSSTQHTYSFSITDPEADTWDFVSTYPTCGVGGALVAGSQTINQAAKTGTFKCTFDDGPASPTVKAKVTDGTAASNELTEAVDVANVAPVATLTRVGPSNVFSGTSVTYNASATDVSGADTTAGFLWSFNAGAYTTARTATAQLVQAYEACGAKSESVTAKDKDSGVSQAATAGVSVYDGGFHGAIVPAARNQVQKGRVVPVQIRVGCDGTPLTGLSPAILLVNGDADPDTDPTDPAVAVATSVSSADTTGVMRPTDEGYIYNLQVPSNATAGSYYTVLVRPWGSTGSTLKAVVQIRK